MNTEGVMNLLLRAVTTGLAAATFACSDGNLVSPQTGGSSPAASFDPAGPAARVEGAVGELSGACPTIRFVIGSFRIVTNNTTLFQQGSCADLSNGTVVDVSGAQQTDGTLFALEVERLGP